MNLNSAGQGWCAANMNSGVTEDDPDTGERVLRLKLNERPPVLDWGVLIGDALFQKNAKRGWILLHRRT